MTDRFLQAIPPFAKGDDREVLVIRGRHPSASSYHLFYCYRLVNRGIQAHRIHKLNFYAATKMLQLRLCFWCRGMAKIREVTIQDDSNETS